MNRRACAAGPASVVGARLKDLPGMVFLPVFFRALSTWNTLAAIVTSTALHFDLGDHAIRQAPALDLEGGTRPRPTRAPGDRWSASASG